MPPLNSGDFSIKGTEPGTDLSKNSFQAQFVYNNLFWHPHQMVIGRSGLTLESLG